MEKKVMSNHHAPFFGKGKMDNHKDHENLLRGKKKPSESDKIEAANLMEEASEVFDSCVRCGMCKAICPVFKVLKEERVSARGKGIILSDKVMDKVVFECTLCRGCEQKCPLGIKICDAIRKVREAMVLSGKGLKSDEKMVENVRKFGNPFWEGEIKGNGGRVSLGKRENSEVER